MCQHLEDPHNSVNWLFPNDPMQDVTELCMSKRSIETASQNKGFNVTEYKKFIGMVSDSILQVTFKKLPLAKF